jgi:sulfur carrier protein ThiS
MVTINFKLTDADKVILNINSPEKLNKLLQIAARKAGVELGAFIAVRNGKIITEKHWVEACDEINVFPAISGG